MIEIIVYFIFLYGLSNLLVYGTGPFNMLGKMREYANKLLKTLGDMLNCMMCTSANIGWIFSAINMLFFNVPFTPMMIMYGGILPWPMIIFFDMCIASGAVWLIHTLQEMMERSNAQ